MKPLLSLITTTAACLATVNIAMATSVEGSLTEFSEKDNQRLDWKVVDDGVMGGLSKGKVSFTDRGTLVFRGELSLENNGGFSSLRTRDINLDLSGSDGLVARVKGDGRTYQMRLASDARYRGMEVSFAADFATKKDEWVEVRVPFDQLVGGWRGRSLKDEVFNPATVQRLGIILADKKSGPFQVEVDWLRTYSGAGGDIVDVALADGRFKTLAAALTQAKLVEAIKGEGPFTVFAPTDEAFAKLPKGTVEELLEPENVEKLQAILKYHVVAGEVTLAGALSAATASTLQGDPVEVGFTEGRVRVNDSSIVNADIRCSNGIIHVIDSVLLPPAPQEEPARNDILGVAKAAGKFNTLLAAVNAAGLSEVLSGEGPITVFAPTDAAFKALPEGTVESLLKEENRDQLRAVLAYHAVAGKVSAGDALNASAADSLQGAKLKFAIDNGVFRVNSAKVLSTDIACDNGVIHVIDAVLLPPSGDEESRKESAKKQSPGAMIESAIEKGVPVFNNGDTSKCAEIYRACLADLSVDSRIDAKVRKMLKEVLAAAKDVEEGRDQAWLYRYALDNVYRSVSH